MNVAKNIGLPLLGVFPHAESRIVSPDSPIVIGKKPKEGAEVGTFKDDVWDFSPFIYRENFVHAYRIIDFSKIVDPQWRILAKEYVWARLNIKVGQYPKKILPTSMREEYEFLISFMEYLQHENLRLKDIIQKTLDSYLNHCRKTEAGAQRSAKEIATYIRIVSRIYAYRMHFSCGGLTFSPWNGRNVAKVAGVSRGKSENATPRIPEEVLNPLIQWSLRYVESFAPHIQERRELVKRYENTVRSRGKPEMSSVERVSRWVEQCREWGRGVPMLTPQDGAFKKAQEELKFSAAALANAKQIMLEAGVADTGSLSPALWKVLEDAVAELGYEQGKPTDTPENILERRCISGNGLMKEEHMLLTACYVICAYFSGMRDSEVQSLRIGCLRKVLSRDGVLERYKVVGTTYKSHSVEGKQVEWVVIEPVAKAIEVLERLGETYGKSTGSLLFSRTSRVLEGSNGAIGRRINTWLNVFLAHVNQFYAESAGCKIPDYQGEPWRLQTRQFRRTVAWFIANRPFGIVAGKIQYKHVSVSTFEGYSGTSESGFRAETEKEKALGQIDDIIERYDDFKSGVRLTAPGATKVEQEFFHIQQTLGDFPGSIVDNLRRIAMLKHLAKTLYPGALSDCYFEPSTALCLLSSKKEHNEPLVGLCVPDKCPNSCVSQRHATTWKLAVDDAEEMLKDKRLQKLQRVAIQNKVSQMKNVLEKLEACNESS